MVRHSFVPMGREEDTLFVAMADPANLEAIDEIEAQLHMRLKTAVATVASIEDALKRGDTAARILQDATAGFRSERLTILRETEQGEEVLDMDRLTGDEEMARLGAGEGRQDRGRRDVLVRQAGRPHLRALAAAARWPAGCRGPRAAGRPGGPAPGASP